MLIREQGHTFKLTRTQRDDGPSKTLPASLSDDEQAAFTRWISVQHNRPEHAGRRHTLDAAHTQLGELIATIDAAAELLSPTDAAAIWRDLNNLARALNRAGYPKPTRERKPPTLLPSQGNLLSPLK